jgi:2-dehydro-3-deoxyphosphogluconate aldolase/(4S)-4-hydroxy-2-oxoglutarate aldolase
LTLDELREVPLIAILRDITGESADRTVEALHQGGIRFVEVTMNTDGAPAMIERWRARYEGKLRIGAGTVLSLSDAEKAAGAGAEYFVCPHLDEAVIAYAIERGLGIFPGALTPTEIVRAYQCGATAVKIFPAASLGLAYLQELQGPLRHIPMIPTGGVTLDNVHLYFAAGATAVGIGSQLADKRLIADGDFAAIRSRAAAFADKVRRNG